MSEYANDVSVSADCVEDHLDDFQSDDRIVEVNSPESPSGDIPSCYDDGHIPEAVGFQWYEDLSDDVERAILSKDDFEATLGAAGIPEIDGRIPGAENVPTDRVLDDDDGTFKTAAELRDLYEAKGVTEDQAVVTDCRGGERSSIAWFVLTELLGYTDVENYAGSWTEWDNLIRAPIATGESD